MLLKMKNFVFCLLFLAVLASCQFLFKKDSKAVESEDVLIKKKIQEVEDWIQHRKDKAKNPGKVDELLFAASLKCPSECLSFLEENPTKHELCLLKCQKKVRTISVSLYILIKQFQILKQNSSHYK
ncbi:hypothetical protein T4E_1301 [Trichinella pseudospiralis]|uniref:Uncharacterized protein n=1 Tax=Trichinella pseudospiralis TaxID=6337 RepID=A0A0V0YG12_TRIPS|nr:hypothetical protein T4E_1301 [Trichinella pseudospiralis]